MSFRATHPVALALAGGCALAAGMGIGTYESFQYVQELGGRIDVHSREGAGTVVTLLMPLFDAGTAERGLALPA